MSVNGLYPISPRFIAPTVCTVVNTPAPEPPPPVPAAPCGMTKSSCSAVDVPELVTEALVPGAPVVVLRTAIVGATPVGPVRPVAPDGPARPCAASKAQAAALPATPVGCTPVL